MNAPTALIAVLAVVAVGLAFYALRVRPTPPPSELGAPTTASPSVTASPSSPEPSPTTSRDDSLLVKPFEPPLVMASATDAFRAAAGTCLGGGAVFRTTDAGISWRQLEVPATAVLTLRAASPKSLQAVVGSGDTCSPVVLSSSNAGRTWSDQPDESLWYRLGDDPRRIHAPTGIVLNPCVDRTVPVVEIQGLSTTDAALLCPEGAVMRSIDGAQFSQVSSVSGASALAFEGRELGWLLVSDTEGCPAFVLYRTIDGGVTWETGGCVGTADDLASAQPPALAFADTQLGMATIGDIAYTTNDGGFTWSGVTPQP